MDPWKRSRLIACICVMLAVMALGLYAATQWTIGWAPLGQRTKLLPLPGFPAASSVLLPQERTNNPFDELAGMHRAYRQYPRAGGVWYEDRD